MKNIFIISNVLLFSTIIYGSDQFPMPKKNEPTAPIDPVVEKPHKSGEYSIAALLASNEEQDAAKKNTIPASFGCQDGKSALQEWRTVKSCYLSSNQKPGQGISSVISHKYLDNPTTSRTVSDLSEGSKNGQGVSPAASRYCSDDTEDSSCYCSDDAKDSLRYSEDDAKDSLRYRAYDDEDFLCYSEDDAEDSLCYRAYAVEKARQEKCDNMSTIQGELPPGIVLYDTPPFGRCGFFGVLILKALKEQPNASAIHTSKKQLISLLRNIAAQIRHDLENPQDDDAALRITVLTLVYGITDMETFINDMINGRIMMDAALISYIKIVSGLDVKIIKDDNIPHLKAISPEGALIHYRKDHFMVALPKSVTLITCQEQNGKTWRSPAGLPVCLQEEAVSKEN